MRYILTIQNDTAATAGPTINEVVEVMEATNKPVHHYQGHYINLTLLTYSMYCSGARS